MASYAGVGFRLLVLRRDGPFVLGLISNDTCNLSCIDCRVANIYGSNMSFDEVRSVLRDYYAKGVRFLYLAGGEPYLWRDGKYRIRDIVRLAREIGYLQVHLYTNGTLRMDADADLTWISIDGTGETFQKIRGVPLERILRHVRPFRGRRAIIFVVNTINYLEIRKFLEYCQREFPGTRVMFYFHTPYYGIDELYLSHAQRQTAVDTILACKRDGFPVINSKVALKSYLAGNPGLPVGYWWIVDQAGAYRCCRASGNPEVCRDCGYTMCGEFLLARNGHPGAIVAMLKMA